ncbi:MAG: FlgD immunoglobulin-like domain containing protein [Armatimonadota bacterium]
MGVEKGGEHVALGTGRRRLMLGGVGLVAFLCVLPCALAGSGLHVEFFKDTPQAWGEFGSDNNYPKPYYVANDPNIDFIFGNNVNQYFTGRWRGYLYVPSSKAGDIEFKIVTDDGARLIIGGQTVMEFWRLQAHQTIGTENDECTHTATVNLAEGYHPITFEYFEWDGGEGDPDPCELYWDDVIIPPENFFTGDPSGLTISNVSHTPSVFNPSQSETATITYTISEAADVTIRLTDPWGTVVRTLVDGAARSSGQHSEVWDGKDDSGEIVDDDIYLYTIEAETNDGDYACYAPGSSGDVDVSNFSATGSFNPDQQETCTISYTLSDAGLVRIRIGADDMLLRTLIDWEQRSSGSHEESWDGRDQSGNLVDGGAYTIAIWAIPVPVNGIQTEGKGQ